MEENPYANSLAFMKENTNTTVERDTEVVQSPTLSLNKLENSDKSVVERVKQKLVTDIELIYKRAYSLMQQEYRGGF